LAATTACSSASFLALSSRCCRVQSGVWRPSSSSPASNGERANQQTEHVSLPASPACVCCSTLVSTRWPGGAETTSLATREHLSRCVCTGQIYRPNPNCSGTLMGSGATSCTFFAVSCTVKNVGAFASTTVPASRTRAHVTTAEAAEAALQTRSRAIRGKAEQQGGTTTSTTPPPRNISPKNK